MAMLISVQKSQIPKLERTTKKSYY